MFVKKIASKIDIKNRALQSLQQGANPYGVATQFIDEMSREDPSFGTSASASLIIEASWNNQMLTEAINNISIDEIPGNIIDAPQGMPSVEDTSLEQTTLEDPDGDSEEELPEEDEGDEYEDLDIPANEIKIEEGLEVKNPITQKRFSIPLSKLKSLKSSIKKVADYKNEQGQAPLAVR